MSWEEHVQRLVGFVLVGVGAFLLVAAGMTHFWAPGVIEKTPEKVNTPIYLTGEATKLDLSNGQQQQVPIKVSSFYLTDTKRSTDDVDVWVNNTCVLVDKNNPPSCVKASDPRLIQATSVVFATSRTTAVAVNNPAYFKGVPGDTKAVGLVNKWPFHVEKRTYLQWDPTLGAAAPATFAGTDTVAGLDTYKFHVQIQDAPIDVAPKVKGTYSLDKTVWVDPITGAIIDQEQHDVRTLEDGTNALNMRISFTDGTVARNVHDAKDNINSINLLTTTVPLIALIAGLLTLLGGLALVLLDRRNRAGDERGNGAGGAVPLDQDDAHV